MAEATNYTLMGDSGISDTLKCRNFNFTLGTVSTADYVELDTGFTPKLITVENLTTGSTFQWNDNLTKAPIAVTSAAAGTKYRITAVGTTDFTAIGARANIVGIEFMATGAGTGTGYVASNDNVCLKKVGTAAAHALDSTNPSILTRERVAQLSQNATTLIMTTGDVVNVSVIGH